MGYEIAGAYGQKIADPSREVIAFVGDGGFSMLMAELEQLAKLVRCI